MSWWRRLLIREPVKPPATAPFPEPPIRRQPRKRGVPPAEYEAALAAYRIAMRQDFAAIAAWKRARAMALGCTHFRWRAAGELSCEVGRGNDGRMFAYNKPGADGLPAEGHCTAKDWCRCRAEPVFADLERLLR
jgi:hypothetical protein